MEASAAHRAETCFEYALSHRNAAGYCRRSTSTALTLPVSEPVSITFILQNLHLQLPDSQGFPGASECPEAGPSCRPATALIDLTDAPPSPASNRKRDASGKLKSAGRCLWSSMVC
jgi:hypothetical protein